MLEAEPPGRMSWLVPALVAAAAGSGALLFAALEEGERAVDVLYRRTDEERLSDDRGQPTPLATLLPQPLQSGTLACVNPF